MPWASCTVTVNVEALEPSAVTAAGLTPNVVVTELGAPATNVTTAEACTDPALAVMVFTSATVDANVAVKTPEPLVVPEEGARLLAVPLLVSVTASLGTG